jgi:hypothetical protein
MTPAMHVDQHDTGDGRTDHTAEVEHHGADAERAGNDSPILHDVLDERLAYRHLERVGNADQRGDGEIGVDALDSHQVHQCEP